MITKIELLEKYRTLKPFVMEPNLGVNLIVGENGSGKSSLLNIIKENAPEVRLEIEGTINYYHFDTEKDNPRTQGTLPFNAPGDVYAYHLTSHFQSHGEVLFPILNLMRTFENRILFYDEPESGVSINNQLKACTAIRKAVRNGCQLFIATHSYIFIKKFKKVFDLKTYQFVKSEDWLSQFRI